ncbi:unnamed protein product [Urochloa humidicola]
MMLFEEGASCMGILGGFCTEDISSPIAAHILDFCDEGLGDDLFAAVTTTSDPFPASSDDVSSSTTTTPPVCSYSDETPAVVPTAYSPLPSFDSTLTALLEQEQHHDLDTELLPPIDGLSEVAYYPHATNETTIEQFSQMELPGTIAEQVPPMQMGSSTPALMPITSDYDECFTAALAGGFMAGLDGAMFQQAAILPSCNAEAPRGFFSSASDGSNSMAMIGEYQKMMEGEGLARTYSDTDSMQGAFNSAEMQVGGNNQHLTNGCNGNPATLPSTELSGLEDSTFKVVRLSPEERKEKIHRYIKKRNERNFSKKIKYACRKTLADSRPRVRGRFAKNDELCEAAQSSSHNNDHYEQTDRMKEEDMMDTSDILAHLSGLNPYNYKYKCSIESWI